MPHENGKARGGAMGVAVVRGLGGVVFGCVEGFGGVFEDYMAESVANGVDSGVGAVNDGGVDGGWGGHDRVDVANAVKEVAVTDGWVGEAATGGHCVEGKNEVCAA